MSSIEDLLKKDQKNEQQEDQSYFSVNMFNSIIELTKKNSLEEAQNEWHLTVKETNILFDLKLEGSLSSLCSNS
jgi:hypothetical protein